MVVFFDLDGTLLDSLEDIARCCNLALDDEGLKPFTLEEYRYFTGEGAKVLAQKITTNEAVFVSNAALRSRRTNKDT